MRRAAGVVVSTAVFVAILVCLILSLGMGLFAVIYTAIKIGGGFAAVTNMEPFMPPEDLENVYVTPCTNKTMGTGNKSYKGNTVIAHNCPLPDNQCMDYLCNSNSKCEPIVEGMGECYDNTQCEPTTFCNRNTCICEPRPSSNSSFGCASDLDCPNISDTPCAEYFCNVMGICEQRPIPPGTCWIDQQCPSPESCDPNTCTCVEIALPCVVNSDCPDISDRGSCVEYVCTNFTCIETILGGGGCWFDGLCASNEMCDQLTCACVPESQCLVDADCPDISDRGQCVEYQCNAGICEETTLGSCWYGGQCGLQQSCNQTSCSCITNPEFQQCTVDADCPDVTDRGICSDYQCQSGICVERILGIGQCWFDGQCNSATQFCNQANCACATRPNFEGCIFNSDCPDISDRGICVFNLCFNNTCVETLTGSGLGQCWFDQQCALGEFCNQNTCGCEPDPSLSGCTVNTDCPDISDRGICSFYICTLGRCIETILNVGQCWLNEQCTPTQTCDQTLCACINPPVPPCDRPSRMKVMPHPVGHFFCGLAVALSQDSGITFAFEACFIFNQITGFNDYVINSYILNPGTSWTFQDTYLSQTSRTNATLDEIQFADLDSWGDVVVFYALNQTGDAVLEILDIDSGTGLTLLQTIIFLNQITAFELDVGIWETDIIVTLPMDDTVIVLTEAVVNTWSPFQNITANRVQSADIFEEFLSIVTINIPQTSSQIEFYEFNIMWDFIYLNTIPQNDFILSVAQCGGGLNLQPVTAVSLESEDTGLIKYNVISPVNPVTGNATWQYQVGLVVDPPHIIEAFGLLYSNIELSDYRAVSCWRTSQMIGALFFQDFNFVGENLMPQLIPDIYIASNQVFNNFVSVGTISRANPTFDFTNGQSYASVCV